MTTFVGLLLLLGIAGAVQMTRNPNRTAARLALAFGTLLLVGLAVFIVRGDLFHASGLEDGGGPDCGYERVC